jgi:hypothetical protein
MILVLVHMEHHAVCCLMCCRRSYALHAELAQRFGREQIGYREVDTIQVCGMNTLTFCCAPGQA